MKNNPPGKLPPNQAETQPEGWDRMPLISPPNQRKKRPTHCIFLVTTHSNSQTSSCLSSSFHRPLVLLFRAGSSVGSGSLHEFWKMLRKRRLAGVHFSCILASTDRPSFTYVRAVLAFCHRPYKSKRSRVPHFQYVAPPLWSVYSAGNHGTRILRLSTCRWTAFSNEQVWNATGDGQGTPGLPGPFPKPASGLFSSESHALRSPLMPLASFDQS